jgi:UDP:flavonoid glycosyltransferase YjiC (YdhE family)
MGGNLKPSKMPLEKRKIILNGLSSRKEKIILKWDDENSSKSLDRKKFFISNWLPQADILAHPNTKVFVTHGGLLGSTEAVYHGIPVVGIPIFGDQRLNMARAQTAGWGVRVDYTNLTGSSFSWALKEVLENPK